MKEEDLSQAIVLNLRDTLFHIFTSRSQLTLAKKLYESVGLISYSLINMEKICVNPFKNVFICRIVR